MKDLEELYARINYRFNDPNLVLQALKHRSYLPWSKERRIASNERLEFVGDAVLGLIVSEYLYEKFPQKEEGDLTKIKSLVVREETLAERAYELNLGEFLLLGDGEEKAGGRERASIIADAFEALIGAIYLDGGINEVKRFVEEQILSNLDEIIERDWETNFKGQLLELLQAKKHGSPIYSVVEERGPDHEKLFVVEVTIDGKPMGRGKGSTKKRAEQMAAQEALEKLKGR